MKTPKQTGFSIAVLLVVILVIAALAGAGWVVYQRAKPSAIKTNTTSNQNQLTNQQGGYIGNQQTQTAQETTFRIPELGVALTLPNSLKDLKYAVDTTSVPGTTFVRITTTTLEAQDGAGSHCTAAESALGAMWKLDRDPATAGAAANTWKQVGSTYLLYSRPQQGCTNNPSTGQLQNDQVKLLEAAVQTAQAI
jgi:type II secretory pathway pseudopilin PulG